MLRAAAAAAAVLAAFFGVMYLRFSGDTVPAADPTPSPAAAPPALTAPPSPEPVVPELLKGMKIIPLELGPPLDLPRNLALILETGCWGCSGGPSGLVRLYVRPDGSLAYEPLIDREELGIPPQLNTAPDGSVYEFRSPLTGYAIRPDGSRIVATMCAREHCGQGGGEHYEWSANSETAIFSSSDGGITWIEIGRLDVGAEVLAILPDDRLLLATFPENLKTTYQTFPDLSFVEPPATASYWYVKGLPNGELIWRDDKGAYWLSNGQLRLTAADIEATRIDDVLLESQSMDGIALIFGNETQAPYSNYLVPFNRSGVIGRGEFALGGESVVWSSHLLRLGVESSNPANPSVIFGNASVPTPEMAPGGYPIVSDYDPVAVDLKAGTIRVLTPFTGGDVPRSRNHIVAVQQGPFARVVNTEGTCLYIRSEPGSAGQPLDCAAEGVLLTDLGPLQFVEGSTWMRVRTPSGVEGWASVNYLEAGARS